MSFATSATACNARPPRPACGRLAAPLGGIAVLLAVHGLSGAAVAQGEPRREIRVALVLARDSAPFREAAAAFEQRLTERGLLPHITRVGVEDALAPAASGADLVLALGTGPAVAADRAIRAPMVFALVGDPSGAGLSRARGGVPRGGVASLPSAVEQVRLIRDLLPSVRSVGVVYDPARSQAIGAAIEAELQRAGLSPVPIHAAGPADVGSAVSRAIDDVDAVVAVPDARLWNGASVKAVVILSLTRRRPLFGFSRSFTKAGAIASLSADDFADMGAQAADLAADLLAGRHVGVEPPRRLSLSLNLVVARRLGVDPPGQVLERTEVVFR